MTLPKATIYTDGSFYEHGKDQPGGWAALIMRDGQFQVPQILSGSEIEAHNNERMELQAMTRALQSLEGAHKIDLYTDTSSLCDIIGGYLSDPSKREEYRARYEEHIPSKMSARFVNRDLFGQMFDALDKHEVAIHWVRGHYKNPWNALADNKAALAVQHFRIKNGEALPPENGRVAVYVAACHAVQDASKAAGWAAVIHHPAQEPELHSGARIGVEQNKHIEIHAIAESLRTLPMGTKVDLYTKNPQLAKDVQAYINGHLPNFVRKIMEQNPNIYNPMLEQLNSHEVTVHLLRDKSKDTHKCLAEEEAASCCNQMRLVSLDHAMFVGPPSDAGYSQIARASAGGAVNRVG